MTIERPTGEYKSRMTEPPAWPEADEDVHAQRSEELTDRLTKLVDTLISWVRTRTSLFDGHTWLGQASDAGRAQVLRDVDRMQSIGEMLKNAIAFHNHTYESIKNAKNHIVAICDAAQQAIDGWNSQSLSRGDQSKRTEATKALVEQAFELNCAVVVSAGTAITAGQVYLPVSDKGLPLFRGPQAVAGGMQSAVGNPASPSSAAPGARTELGTTGKAAPLTAPNPATPKSGARTAPDTTGAAASPTGTPAPLTAARVTSDTTPADSARNASYSTPPTNSPPATQTRPGAPSAPGMGTAGSPLSTGGSPSGGSSSPASSAASSSGRTGTPSATTQSKLETAEPKVDAAKGASAGQGGGTGQAPAEQFAKGLPSTQAQPTLSAASATGPVTPLPSPSAAPDAAPIAHTSGSTSGGGVGSGAGGGGFSGGGSPGGGGSFGSPSSGTPMPPPMPLGPPATPPPAGPATQPGASTPAAANTGPGVNPASTGKTDVTAGMTPVPVSSARMERDAIVASSTAGAMQRQKGNSNAALMQARRIAAALNITMPHYAFFWVTGLMADGSIVVANSYGLAYIPDGVDLPPQVTMATADESIPPAERAKWVTYPILAIQGWARAHDQKLRVVIATAEQFASFDPGVPKVVLQADDIPESGKMEGRSRLEVISPNAATQLAAVRDGALQELLPVAPTDSTPPDDQSAPLWFELTKPLMSTATDRAVVHLQAFINYADHAQVLALHKAHNAIDAVVQRTAIADWVYWQHLSVLMSDAIGVDAAV